MSTSTVNPPYTMRFTSKGIFFASADSAMRGSFMTAAFTRSLSSAAVKTGRRLRRHHLESLVDLAGRMGLRRLLTSGRRVPSLDPQLKRNLSEMFAAEFEELERSWGLDLSTWRDQDSAPRRSATRNAESQGSP